MTGSDVAGLISAINSKDNAGAFGENWIWIIGLLIVAGIFGGGSWFGGNRANGLETDIDTRFLERDIFNTNQNVSNTACQTQRDVLENRFNCSQNACVTQKEVLQNRYDTSLGLANIDKDILLGNQNLQAQLATCCCDLKTAVHAEGEATRNMLQQDKIEQLREQVNTTNLALSNANLANQIISTVRPFPSPSYIVGSPYTSLYTPYSGCGCGNTTII